MKNAINNIFKNLQIPDVGGEIFTTLLKHKNVEIEIINSNKVQNGQLYKQEQDEWVVILTGEATLEIEDEIQILVAGDSLFIEKNVSHRVVSTDTKTLWLAIHIF
jgi:cupin 2 domain-containing protein